MGRVKMPSVSSTSSISGRESPMSPPSSQPDGHDRRPAAPVAHHEGVSPSWPSSVCNLHGLQKVRHQSVFRQLVPPPVQCDVQLRRWEQGHHSRQHCRALERHGRQHRVEQHNRWAHQAGRRAPGQRDVPAGVRRWRFRRSFRRKHQGPGRLPSLPRQGGHVDHIASTPRFDVVTLDGTSATGFDEKPEDLGPCPIGRDRRGFVGHWLPDGPPSLPRAEAGRRDGISCSANPSCIPQFTFGTPNHGPGGSRGPIARPEASLDGHHGSGSNTRILRHVNAKERVAAVLRWESRCGGRRIRCASDG